MGVGDVWHAWWQRMPVGSHSLHNLVKTMEKHCGMPERCMMHDDPKAVKQITIICHNLAGDWSGLSRGRDTTLTIVSSYSARREKKISCLGLNREALASYSGGPGCICSAPGSISSKAPWSQNSLQGNEPVKVMPYGDGGYSGRHYIIEGIMCAGPVMPSVSPLWFL